MNNSPLGTSLILVSKVLVQEPVERKSSIMQIRRCTVLLLDVLDFEQIWN